MLSLAKPQLPCHDDKEELMQYFKHPRLHDIRTVSMFA
jgi:hypothetical protein